MICVIRLILNDVSQFFQLGKRTHGRLFQVGCFLKLWRLILFNPIIVAGRLTEMKHLQIQRYLPLHEELKQYFVIEVQLCKAFTQKIMLALTLFLENDWVRLLKTCYMISFEMVVTEAHTVLTLPYNKTSKFYSFMGVLRCLQSH